ncbi:MAG: Rieske (2Fe-2S) protein [Planctomycetales bacterium]|nr:Rieske (2Fe-2S) protein [Planctomycetales bacterium]
MSERHPVPPAPPTRRDVLDRLLLAGGAAAGAGMLGPAALYLWPAGSRGPAEAFLAAGALKDLPVGDARLVQARGRPVLLLRRSETEVRAFSAICTHLGCVVRWDRERQVIACPCHAAVFSAEGQVLSGPPPRPLAELPVTVSGDDVRIRVG